jgi:hypothetical protein
MVAMQEGVTRKRTPFGVPAADAAAATQGRTSRKAKMEGAGEQAPAGRFSGRMDLIEEED